VVSVNRWKVLSITVVITVAGRQLVAVHVKVAIGTDATFAVTVKK
jgi:hypothetical protein